MRGKPEEREIDIANYKLLLSLIQAKGYPDGKTLGVKRRINLSAMLIHFGFSLEEDDYNNLKNVIYENILIGKASPEDYKLFVSAHHLLYGDNFFGDTDPLFEEKSNKREVDSIINKRRKKIGLPTLQYEIWKNNKLLY